MRSSRQDRFEPLLGPGIRFLWGTTLLVIFLFQQNPILKLLLVAVFASLAIAAGKRIRFGYFLTLVVSITVFNLLTPCGQVLAVVGPLRITKGALVAGATKGLTIVGLVFASLFTVSRYLVLPGSFGLFLARSFFYFERLYSEKKRIRRDHVIEDIDAIMERVSKIEEAPLAAAARRRTTAKGMVVALVLLGTVATTLVVPATLLPSLR
jgi:hypothetical protein